VGADPNDSERRHPAGKPICRQDGGTPMWRSLAACPTDRLPVMDTPPVDAGEHGGSELAGQCTFSPRESHQWMARAQHLVV